MKLRLTAPRAVIDINNVAELSDGASIESGMLRIGARLRHHTIELPCLPATQP